MDFFAFPRSPFIAEPSFQAYPKMVWVGAKFHCPAMTEGPLRAQLAPMSELISQRLTKDVRCRLRKPKEADFELKPSPQIHRWRKNTRVSASAYPQAWNGRMPDRIHRGGLHTKQVTQPLRLSSKANEGRADHSVPIRDFHPYRCCNWKLEGFH